MVWYLLAPSHYLNPCWHITKVFCGIHLGAMTHQVLINLIRIICDRYSEITILKLLPHLTGPNELTHWGWDKVDAISQTAFSSAFSWIKMPELWLNFHWSLFLRVQLTLFPALVQIMAWPCSDDKPLSEPMMVSSRTHICITRPQWVKQYYEFSASIDLCLITCHNWCHWLFSP